MLAIDSHLLSSSYLLSTIMYSIFFFFFNDTATTEIYTLSLHDALPIFLKWRRGDFGQAKLLLVDPGKIVGEPGQCRADFRVVGELRARRSAAVMRNAGGPDWHGQENNPKGHMFHRGVPSALRDQLRAASAQRACTSVSVRTREDCLAASKMRVTSASSAGGAGGSSQKRTVGFALLGARSMDWCRGERWGGAPRGDGAGEAGGFFL